ncbi:hypothetical protein P153DRAFT_388760 [Dothidotthia symphoricarpi CBS 119687]|uniref:Uncharacterized protein n=1 Tax=Dothidotthia symphoricarpi CBS 119687 TaxID=1392245 RepID=A0A6A6A5G1_9PLEO|nr:uncharacterized protein P153DRAFT_388760 [Dothidotthia symphoricarpi CBS 119687]KAF2126008.1 hypothetical protein P153DRAFT_388760 [Dothidotthia symphoricarpi CBS 119687]
MVHGKSGPESGSGAGSGSGARVSARQDRTRQGRRWAWCGEQPLACVLQPSAVDHDRRKRPSAFPDPAVAARHTTPKRPPPAPPASAGDPAFALHASLTV